MLISKEAEVQLNSMNIKYYEDKGYKIPREKDDHYRIRVPRGIKIKIKVIDLQVGSHALVNIKCDGSDCESPYLNPMNWANYLKFVHEDGIYYCKNCALKHSDALRLTLSEVIENLKIINPNIRILSKEYKNSKIPLKCECLIDNYKWDARYDSLAYKKSGCPKCYGNIKLTLDEIKIKSAVISPNIEILSTEYINMYEHLKCKCSICNHIWDTASWGGLRHGNGCPNCKRATLSGEGNHGWKGGISLISDFLRSSIREWKISSFKKYDYKCILSGKGNNLIIHHLYSFNTIVKEVFNNLHIPIYKEINQYSTSELNELSEECLNLHYKYGLGVCLTEEVHKLFHKVYGLGDNTYQQFEEFTYRFNNNEFNKNLKSESNITFVYF